MLLILLPSIRTEVASVSASLFPSKTLTFVIRVTVEA